MSASGFDSIDQTFIEILRSEFSFAGDGRSEASLMMRVADRAGHGSVWNVDAIAADTAKWKDHFLMASEALGIDPSPILRHHFLVIPDYSFGASSRKYQDRDYVLLFSGCMHFSSYAIELNIICTELLINAPEDQLTQAILEWIVNPGRDLARRYLSVPCDLPLLRPYLTEQMSMQEFFDVSSAELFIIFHEIAHIELGHLGAGFGELGATSALPTAAEEYEADQFAIEQLKSGKAGALFGALTFLSFLAELDSKEKPACDGPVSFYHRFLAVREKLNGEHLNTVHYAHFVDAPLTTANADWRILIRQLLWGCEQMAKELNIPLKADESGFGPDQAEERPLDMLSAAASVFSSKAEELSQVLAQYLQLPNEWKAKRAFIDEHPVLLSADLDDILRSIIMKAKDDDTLHHSFSCDLALLRRCREVGTAKARPIRDIVADMMTSSQEDQIEQLKAHPHVLSNEGEAEARLIRSHLARSSRPELISRAAQVGSLIKRVRDSSIDAVLDENKKRPRLPDAIYEIAAKLEVAVSQGDIRRQAELCQSALGLAAAEGDLPSWALLFKAHLEALPEF